MRASDRVREFIKKHEALRLKAYKCPAGVWTIGYGHTKGVSPSDVITLQQAEKFFNEDVKSSEISVLRLVRKPLTQNQFDALVSFVFNIGAGKFQDSTLLRIINTNPNDQDIDRQFKRWVYSKGVILPGLKTRREEESKIYHEK